MSVHKVILIRHAKANDSSSNGDKGRSLSPAGEKESRELGKNLAGQLVDVGTVFVSPAARATETWEQIVVGSGLGQALPKPSISEIVYEGHAQNIVDVIKIEGRGDTVVIVGHEPTISEVGRLLAKDSSGIPTLFSTATAAVLSASKDWKEWHSHVADLDEIVKA